MSNVTPIKVASGTNLRVVDVQWFSGRDCVGAVLCEDIGTGAKKAYIGVAGGLNADDDCEQIAMWGTKITKGHAEALFGTISRYDR